MLFKSQFAVGAFLLSIALGGAEIVNEGRNLRGAGEQEERELMPWGHGTGYGYAQRNNRYSAPRTRGQVQGSAYLRPNPYDSLFNAYNPHDDDAGSPPPTTKSAKGPKSGTPGAASPKAGKSGKAGKAGKGGAVAKLGKAAKHVSATLAAAPADHDVNARPTRGRSYLNTMHWQRVPGQPIFVSATDTPIIIIDEKPDVVIDDEGNVILTDPEGNEIAVTVNAQGDPEIVIVNPIEEP